MKTSFQGRIKDRTKPKGGLFMTKLTRHNGRTGKDGTYSPKHNDRKFDLEMADHIDKDRALGNVYWDYVQGYHNPLLDENKEKTSLSFDEVEAAFYFEQYSDYCDGQHERNKKTGHSERDRTPEDLRLDKRTCPEESILQIGTMENSVSPEVLAQIAEEFFGEFDRRFGENIHILDWSLHLDEATPHIHERHVFDCKNQYGEVMPQQEKALEALGFDLPNPDKKMSKNNNRKISFDATCRVMLFDICKKHGLHLDEEPEFGNRKYLEKNDYIIQKQKELLAQKENELSKVQSQLEELTIKVDDIEALVDEVAEAAYDKAVDVVTKVVQVETMREDLHQVEKVRDILDDKTKHYPKKEKAFAGKVLDAVAKRIRNAMTSITRKITDTLRNPETKKQNLEPIRKQAKKSILAMLRENEELVRNAPRAEKRISKDMER